MGIFDTLLEEKSSFYFNPINDILSNNGINKT